MTLLDNMIGEKVYALTVGIIWDMTCRWKLSSEVTGKNFVRSWCSYPHFRIVFRRRVGEIWRALYLWWSLYTATNNVIIFEYCYKYPKSYTFIWKQIYCPRLRARRSYIDGVFEQAPWRYVLQESRWESSIYNYTNVALQ